MASLLIGETKPKCGRLGSGQYMTALMIKQEELDSVAVWRWYIVRYFGKTKTPKVIILTIENSNWGCFRYLNKRKGLSQMP